jgi:Bacterial regulatory protein, Fis family
MSARDNFTTEQIIEVLEACGGIVVYAAQRLGVHRNTLHNWIKDEPELKQAQEGTEETLLDIGEANLVKALKAGDWEATRFYLTTKGRKRGYGIRAEISGENGGPIRTAAEPPIDFSKLTTEEIEQYVRITEKASVQSGGGEAGAGKS